MVMKVEVHSICIVSLKLFAIWLVVIKLSRRLIYEILCLGCVPSENRIVNSSSQHGDKGGCLLSLYCKFEINLRLFAIWLVTIKLLR